MILHFQDNTYTFLTTLVLFLSQSPLDGKVVSTFLEVVFAFAVHSQRVLRKYRPTLSQCVRNGLASKCCVFVYNKQIDTLLLCVRGVSLESKIVVA